MHIKLHLSKCSGSVLGVEPNIMKFNFQPPSTIFPTKMLVLKVVYPLTIHQHSKFHSLSLTGASSLATSEIRTSPILERFQGTRLKSLVIFNGMTLY
jgi:hypothetical protein